MKSKGGKSSNKMRIDAVARKPDADKTGGPTLEAKAAFDWANLLAADRLPGLSRKKEVYGLITDHRTDHERDFDRVVFCTPVRRLKDKTQVFPLDMHDGVRTRLTHSMEVSNLARSMGTAITALVNDLSGVHNSHRNVPALLATIALAHDLGNPPFGHQGEVAIQGWVKAREDEIAKKAGDGFSSELLKDFLLFEGNAQGFRILARLQHQDHKSGLRLTASTLRAFMKYPWHSGAVKSGGPKKFGYFHSERDVFEWTCKVTGVDEGVRHPLSYLMEVCDDIAYSILDIEDAVKKELISVAELTSFIGSDERYSTDDRVMQIIGQYKDDRDWLDGIRIPGSGKSKIPLSSKEIRDSQIDIIRSYCIGLMVSDAVDRFVQLEAGGDFTVLKKGIAEDFKSSKLVDALKEFAFLRVYKHPSVLKAELRGHLVLPELMSAFWNSIVKHQKGNQSKVEEYVMSLMSPNYVRVFRQSEDLGLPLWYRQVQLVCDQVCGMTDSYALRIHSELKELGCI